tara:strand:- start:277 stop:1326 length:1050 start_codon:yes stop_codon:yes gene_type:complete
MTYTTINKCTSVHNSLNYTGNGSTNAKTGLGFQPDIVWNKNRGSTNNHVIHDSLRGVANRLQMGNNAQQDTSDAMASFDSDGFTMTGTGGGINGNTETYATWCWKAGTTSGLSGGTITPTSYSINTTSKVGIYRYQGNGTAGASIAHGLGVVPACMWIKSEGANEDWILYHKKFNNGVDPEDYVLKIRASSRTETNSAAYFNDTAHTSSLFYLGDDGGVNSNGTNYIAYVFGEVPGYSAFTQYHGNANADGSFCYLGFAPKTLIICRRNSDDEIEIYDDNRLGYNPNTYHLNMNLNTAEATLTGRLDLLSNGFKVRASSSGPLNASTQYLVMAWGQSLVGSNNVPCTAR